MNRRARISVLWIVSFGVKFVLSHSLQIVLMLLQAAVIVFALSFVSDGLAEAAISLVLCPIAVAIHRDIVLGEPLAPASYFRGFATARVWKFWGFVILAAVCVAVFALLGSLTITRVMNVLSVTSSTLTEAVLFNLFSLIGTLFVASFAFVLPAVAVEQYGGIWAAKHMLSGNYWRVIAALAIVGFIVTVLNAAWLFLDFSGLPAVPRLLAMYALATAIALSMLMTPATLSIAYSTVLSRQAS